MMNSKLLLALILIWGCNSPQNTKSIKTTSLQSNDTLLTTDDSRLTAQVQTSDNLIYFLKKMPYDKTELMSFKNQKRLISSIFFEKEKFKRLAVEKMIIEQNHNPKIQLFIITELIDFDYTIPQEDYYGFSKSSFLILLKDSKVTLLEDSYLSELDGKYYNASSINDKKEAFLLVSYGSTFTAEVVESTAIYSLNGQIEKCISISKSFYSNKSYCKHDSGRNCTEWTTIFDIEDDKFYIQQDKSDKKSNHFIFKGCYNHKIELN